MYLPRRCTAATWRPSSDSRGGRRFSRPRWRRARSAPPFCPRACSSRKETSAATSGSSGTPQMWHMAARAGASRDRDRVRATVIGWTPQRGGPREHQGTAGSRRCGVPAVLRGWPRWPWWERPCLAACARAGPLDVVAGVRPGPRRRPTVPSDHDDHRAPLPVTPVQWSPCGGDRQCGSVTVPLNYSNPEGPTIQIAVERRPAQ